ncbi:TPM domain-containing protein, partial [Agromyces terreus]|uniref:TPM domain-containing protein n=1 Tax=Agromyces terreus TaxID=424795 RepID=UPI0031D85DED
MASSRGGRISIDRILATAVVTAALLLVGGSPAWAEDPVSFGADPVVDTVGALGDDADDVRAAIEKTADDTGRQLFVAYVDEFTNPEQADTWANDTAVANNMGAEDYLLAVAIDGRAYYLSAAGNASVTDDQLDRISLREIEPALRDGDWAGAAIAAAEALDDGSGGSGWGWVWFLVLAAVAVAVIAIVLSRRRRRQAPDASGATAPAVPLPELRRRAATALVAADDAIKTSEEELGFAVASYGDAASSAARQALETAKAGVAEAFRLQQRLDDEVPDTEAQQREVYEGILAATAAADALLDEQAEAFAALRDLERNAPAELERVRAEAAAARATTAPADARLRALSGEYAASALAALAD